MKGLSELGITFTGISQGLVTSQQQLRIHKAMATHWGYDRLSTTLGQALAAQEACLDSLLLSLLALEIAPDLQVLGRLNIGQTVEEILQSERRMALDVRDLALAVLRDLPPAQAVVRRSLEEVLLLETQHVSRFDQSLELIRQMGIQNFLATRC
jgi:bacterioferritin